MFRPHKNLKSSKLCVKTKSFPSHKAYRATLIFVSIALIQTPVYTARLQIQGWFVARCASKLSYVKKHSVVRHKANDGVARHHTV